MPGARLQVEAEEVVQEACRRGDAAIDHHAAAAGARGVLPQGRRHRARRCDALPGPGVQVEGVDVVQVLLPVRPAKHQHAAAHQHGRVAAPGRRTDSGHGDAVPLAPVETETPDVVVEPVPPVEAPKGEAGVPLPLNSHGGEVRAPEMSLSLGVRQELLVPVARDAALGAVHEGH